MRWSIFQYREITTTSTTVKSNTELVSSKRVWSKAGNRNRYGSVKLIVQQIVIDLSDHRLKISKKSFLREDINENRFLSGIAQMRGGGGLPMPEFFGPFSRSAFLVNNNSLFLQKCQCIELLTVFQVTYLQYIIKYIQYSKL